MKKIVNILSAGIVFTSTIGILTCLKYIIINRYIQYKMFGLVGIYLKNYLNKSLGLLFIFLVGLFTILVISGFMRKISVSSVIKIHITNNNKITAIVICFLFFFCGGWAINHYWLSNAYRFNPISSLTDIGIMLFTILLWWILIKRKWIDIFNDLKIKIVALVLLVLLVILNLSTIIAVPKGPNIILLSIETTRTDHLGCYGYERNTSPTIDKLANEGILFSNMFVQRGSTWPSLTSMMTSLYPVNHGVRKNGIIVSRSILSVAEILKNNGYNTGAFLANATKARWKGFDKIDKRPKNDIRITQEAIEWLKENFKKRIFLWIHYWEPHIPYQPPKPYDSIFNPGYTGLMNGNREQIDEITLKKIKLNKADLNQITSLYDGSILFVDDQIKQILTTLKSLGIEENSLVIITADHGEDLYQHNFYFYHGSSIYDSSLHIPFIMKLPNKIPKNIRVDKIVESIDITPTILELAGIPIPHRFEGHSLIPLILSKDKTYNFLYAFSEIEDKILSIRTDKYRYIFNPTDYNPKTIENASEDTYPIEKEELYDIIKDPKELNNIVSKNPEIAQELMKKISGWDNFKFWVNKDKQKDQKVSEDIKEHLRSLGYAQ